MPQSADPAADEAGSGGDQSGRVCAQLRELLAHPSQCGRVAQQGDQDVRQAEDRHHGRLQGLPQGHPTARVGASQDEDDHRGLHTEAARHHLSQTFQGSSRSKTKSSSSQVTVYACC